MSPPHHASQPRITEGSTVSPVRRIYRFLLPLLVLGAGAGAAYWLILTAPHVRPRPVEHQARLVEVVPVRFGLETVRLPAFGTVIPAREVTLYPRVSGEIVRIAETFQPGSRFEAGAELVRIDPRDFQLAVAQRESELVQARGALALEQGQQAVARKEYELLGREIPEADRDLVLRMPQLRQAEARVQAAEAALEQARLNLERTVVRAPFNCVVRERFVNVGSQVTPATPVATLAGTDEYWVETTVPVDDLHWLAIPNWSSSTGSVARVWRVGTSPARAAWSGVILKLLPDLEKQGRLARLLVSVERPWGREPQPDGPPPLLLGDAVRLELQGRTVRAAVIDRRWFRDGDQLWIMNERDELEIRSVEVAFRGPDSLWVTGGLREGERIVISELPAAVPGLPLRVAGGGEPSPAVSTTAGAGARVPSTGT
ncbi:efflux RND transporter periplasmic adaptor subunit [Limisphaera ngatamarikiensis]|uniref:Efflux RND transporter periplasmic adaptor subunit n=1 Tax=Limisphaera ngatamarikiensis TaxID=1324935 RepID=A0A6M1RM08_9BACT|nr:efflux RND transporter periplasmic adaptor subunit [Limisphaera ngatamarikiensis]NGO38693.1 efflux RND transporter periplasmic adaptor subunit [Limisphaera ngatamarikiensis]